MQSAISPLESTKSHTLDLLAASKSLWESKKPLHRSNWLEPSLKPISPLFNSQQFLIPKHCWHCCCWFQAVLVPAGAGAWPLLQNQHVGARVRAFATFMISAISTRLIFTLTSSLFICWCSSAAGSDCLSSWTNMWRWAKKNAHGRNMKLSRPCLNHKHVIVGRHSHGRMCWCRCLAKSVQYAALNHKVGMSGCGTLAPLS